MNQKGELWQENKVHVATPVTKMLFIILNPIYLSLSQMQLQYLDSVHTYKFYQRHIESLKQLWKHQQ